MSNRKYTVVLIKEAEGGYSVIVPDLPGCYTQGETIREAMENAHEAILCYLEGEGKNHQPSRRSVLLKEIKV